MNNKELSAIADYRNRLTATYLAEFGPEAFLHVRTRHFTVNLESGTYDGIKVKRNKPNRHYVSRNISDYDKLRYRLNGFKRKSINTDNFTIDEFLAKFANPKCYLTGVAIDLYKSKYHLEHIIPISSGGSSNLDNLELSIPIANIMKSNVPLDEFIATCKLIASNFQ